MFYYYDDTTSELIVKKAELLFVPEFSELQQAFGFNALQYLFLFSAVGSPYFQSRPDEETRHVGVVDAIRQKPWDNRNKMLPKRFYEDDIFKKAVIKLSEFDDNSELEEFTIIKESRRNLLQQIKAVSKQRETDIFEFNGAVRAVIKAKVMAHKSQNDKKVIVDQLMEEITLALKDLIDRTFDGLAPVQLKDLNLLLAQLKTLGQHHETVRKAAKDRVKLDEGVSIVFGEHR